MKEEIRRRIKEKTAPTGGWQIWAGGLYLKQKKGAAGGRLAPYVIRHWSDRRALQGSGGHFFL